MDGAIFKPLKCLKTFFYETTLTDDHVLSVSCHSFTQLDGFQTQGENIADIGGLKESYKVRLAYSTIIDLLTFELTVC